MKYLVIILIAFISCGYAQYPLPKIDQFGKVYNANQFDSAKYYDKKEAFWQRKYEKEIKKLNRTGHKNDISESLLRFQDSVIRYKLLLSKLKKY